ncbi:MAG: methyltransferase domain-containing protein [Nitrospirota bacterium]|nr:MAG: methyltransferase domain-containing protein [Nitrospirota bacterium]
MLISGKNRDQKKGINEILGPVEDLESYVRADWWKHIFNANYLRTDGDVVQDEVITKDEMDRFISIMGIEKNSSVLDLCCGQGRHSLELAKRGFINVTGLDRSHYLVTKARATAKKNGHRVMFKEGDARKLPFPDDTFDFVMLLGNSFGYFESLHDDLQVLKEIRRVLMPWGKLLIDVSDGPYLKQNFEPRSWEWIDNKYFVCRERSLSKHKDRLISREVITHVKKGIISDQFYAERLYSFETLGNLLFRADLSDITSHTEIFTRSKRNQDLGMMAKRIVISAIAKKERSALKQKGTIKTIAVLMGDPRRMDIVKPEASFDDDDHHTINELKKELSRIEGYNFIYMDRHENLIDDLRRSKDRIDLALNLCDEGFFNDASKELHVPAILEVLKINYSGGTPQCLSYCYDKSLIRGVAKEMDIPVPKAFLIKPDDTTFIELLIDFPVIVKPNFGDSSFGITKDNVCNDIEALENAITNARDKFGYNKPILVEQFLTGKDMTLGIIGNPPGSYKVLPIIEEDYSMLPADLPKICGYEAKWLPASPYWQVRSVQADLPEDTKHFMIASCLRLFERLECRDYARFDWRMDRNNTPRLLEVNPNPGWCWDGHLAKMAAMEGLSYGQMLREILKASEQRIAYSNVIRASTEHKKAHMN